MGSGLPGRQPAIISTLSCTRLLYISYLANKIVVVDKIILCRVVFFECC